MASTSSDAPDRLEEPRAEPSDHAAFRRTWFPPSIEDFEITPEAAMYAGRR
jgi:hypothetical protein